MLLETPVNADRLNQYVEHYAAKGLQLPTSVYKVIYGGQHPKVNATYWLLQPNGTKKALRLDTVTLHSQLSETFRKARETQVKLRLAATRMRLYIGDDPATAIALMQDTLIPETWAILFSTDNAAQVA